MIGNHDMGSPMSQEVEGFQSRRQVVALHHHRQGEWNSENSSRAGTVARVLNSRNLDQALIDRGL